MTGGRGRQLPRLTAVAIRLLWVADRRTFVIGTVLQFIAGAGFAVQLLIANRLLKALLAPNAGRHSLPFVASLVAVAAVVLAALSFATAAQAGVRKLLGERVVRHVQGLILDTAASVDVIDFADPSFYDRLQRAQVQGVPTPLTISGSLLEGCAALVGSVGISVALLIINPVLLPLVLFGAIPAWLASGRSSKDLYSFSYGNTPNDRMRGALSLVVTARGNADEVRAFSLYPFIRQRWDALYRDRINEAAELVRSQLVRYAAASVVSAVVTAGVFGLLAYLFLAGRSTLAAAATAAFAAQQLGSRLLSLAMSTAVLYENVLYLDDFDSFVQLRNRAEETRVGADRDGRREFRQISVDSVSFRYPNAERRAVDEVSLTINSGEIVALVGENGSGKTTLAKLLCGLYEPESGSIAWDNDDLRDLDPGATARSIAVIFQDFVRYPLSVAENVGVGNVDRVSDRPAIEESLRAAGALDLASGLPNGLDTILGTQFDGGTELSVGQWQRIALARAFFRGAPFIVLDEPTAALDPRAERALFDSIRQLCAGRTVLLISHRFSSVRSADRIIVLDQGHITEQGTHEELMRLGGIYADMFTLQASAYLDDGTTRSSTSP